ncbi:peptide maturation system acyl carrier-related protein [Paenibacillus macerans]|uniref:Peptide maturation system acyl carrier-related protein n=1 Tax=Paenibacillus macerans TaxID=44252 RepID=A0A6N8EUL0_PAEMA|nr:peptide maturation system acyl carrier-related protein [Paenibacillus macerans]MUG23707.1 peptide maturation system acyl carrier-related protein [Paenibacillus macerans]
MNIEEVYKRLDNIFLQRFNMNVPNEFKEKSLLGQEVGLTPRELVYLFFDIEKLFKITIPEEDIVTGKFYSYKDVSEIIVQQLALVYA